MKTTTFLNYRSLALEEVLEVFRDEYRFSIENDPESMPGYDLTFDTTIRDLRSALDLVGADELGAAFNQTFGMSVGAAEWRGVLEPAKRRTLGELCDLIARHGSAPAVRPFRVFGTDCGSAGAFLTMRSLLAQDGLPTQELRPSTALSDLARDQFGSIFSHGSMLAPGALPTPVVEDAFPRLSKAVAGLFLSTLFAGMLLGVVELTVGMGDGLKWPLLRGLLSFYFVCFVGCTLLWRLPPKTVIFPGLDTFSDLSRAIAKHKDFGTVS